jgi:hypothetical protein
MKDTLNTNKQIEELKKIIGGWAYRALCCGASLIQWRGTSPHNWFIESMSRPGTYLWHSEDDNRVRKIPNISMFNISYESKDKIMDSPLVGSDANKSREVHYILKNQFRAAFEKANEI